MRAQCVPPNSRGSCKGQISCGKTCCNGICLTIKKGFRSTFEKCCPPGTYLKEDNGEYTCESVCKPNEIYDSEKRKCEGKKGHAKIMTIILRSQELFVVLGILLTHYAVPLNIIIVDLIKEENLFVFLMK